MTTDSTRGPPQVRVLGAIVVGSAAPGLRLRRLLAALVARSGHVLSLDALSDAVWGDDQPAVPEAALHNLVSRLRGLLREAGDVTTTVQTRPPGYLLDAGEGEVDAQVFETLVRRAQEELADRPDSAASLLEEALSLWQGPAYAELSNEDYVRPEASRLEELRGLATEECAEALMRLDRPGDAVPLLQRLLAAEPLRERAQAKLMGALYRSGRQADALEAYAAYRDVLAEELGIDPSRELQELHEGILRQERRLDEPHPPVRAPATGNLPANLPELVARDIDAAALSAALVPGAVVTLTGPGGVGKTSLALQVAAMLEPDLAGGAWFCDLSTLSPRDDLAYAVTSVLDLQAGARADALTPLLAHLGTRRLLLVLDNCEHVLEGAASLAHAVHQRCPDVTVLATSRAALEIAGERVLPLSPLPAPAAVALFLDRTRRRVDGFELTDDNAQPVAEICRRLDGLPLAIELAAARMGSMSPADLAQRLSWRFRILHGGAGSANERHRTLGALLDWSYDLLDEQHQQVFEMLSAFAGDFDLDDAVGLVLAVPEAGQAVDEGVVAHVVLGLADRSLLQVTRSGGATQYLLLESLRDYGRQRLSARDWAAAVPRAHAHLVARRVAGITSRLYGPDHVEASRFVTAYLDELRAAHSWALVHDLGLASRLVGSLALYVEHRIPAEVPQWAERTIEAAPAGTPDLAGAYAVAAAGARFTGDLHHAAELAERGLALVGGDARIGGYLRIVLGEVALFEGRLDDVVRLRAEVRELSAGEELGAIAWLPELMGPLVSAYRGDPVLASRQAEAIEEWAVQLGSGPLRAWALYIRGEARLDTDPETSLELFDAALELARQERDRYVVGVALVSIASLRGRHGNPAEAVPRFVEVIGHWQAVGDWTHQWTTLRSVVDLLVRLGRCEEAAVLLGGLRSRAGAAPVFGADADRLASVGARLAHELGDDAVAELLGRGARLTDDGVVTFAGSALVADGGAAGLQPNR
ncbi:BTAD domain-containing putative transcriptional regulator [Nocardioides sp.]|uniref:BTAD domain-containing putative transcriptional regulator n=1 Tax=Nocardioides sp. TaxID=35761 RepID=UPI00273717C7|nr:BTAD domain-containing putative transcriptional regulator [Nocardioides sp.]MDP3893874.1 BTAD domain-containing putative transcriptional regulator [Nocardioides sp.]